MNLCGKLTVRTRLTWLWTLLRLLVYSTILVLALLVLHSAVLPLVGWLIPALQGTFFDLAVYGAYPTESYKSFDRPGPLSNVVQWDDSCNDGLVLVSPYGPAPEAVSSHGPMILDAQGRLVWTTGRYDDIGTVMNFRVQKWKGQNYLTFWVGNKFGFAGQGEYVILDSSYNLVKTVNAVGGQGDLHEFDITESGTALLTIYAEKQTDTRKMGMWRPEDGWIFDSQFQEIDLESGELLFEWKAADYYTVEQSSHRHPLAGYSEWLPYDFFHINSVHKDADGNYLISSRHLGAVIYINGSSGAVEWVLGGDYGLNDFEDLSDGKATDFSWQHDARWVSCEDDACRVRILSLFDNHSAGPLQFNRVKWHSEGLLLRLDLDNKTASLIQSYTSRPSISSASQGSMQVLPPQHEDYPSSSASILDPSTHILIEYGSCAAYTEFALDGTPLCETHLEASWSFWWERARSYRAYKVFDWVGEPDEPPSVVVEGETVFVSWNGATEVRQWELQGRKREGVEFERRQEEDDEEWQTISTVPKTGFETSIAIPPEARNAYDSLRVAALDKDGALLRYSDAVSMTSSSSESSGPITMTSLALIIILIIVVGFIYRIMRARRQAALTSSWSLPSSRSFFARHLGRGRGGEDDEALEGKWMMMRDRRRRSAEERE